MADHAQRYDFEEARTYWRHAPSGSGKHDTSDMLQMSDEHFREEWKIAFDRRFLQYPEESIWLQGRAREFAGKRVLSIGSGIGLHELYYLAHGAELTCCDIVGTNLEVIARAARVMGLAAPRLLLSDGPDFDLGGPYDVVFIYGSLMTMPPAAQSRLIARAAEAAAPGATIMLMLYTWKFAADTCGWLTPDEFRPEVFAKASDPSVGQEHCPWSDWHDEAKLSALFSAAGLADRWRPARRQLWNNDWYVWYDYTQDPPSVPSPYFESDQIYLLDEASTIDLATLIAADATIEHDDGGLNITTTTNQFHYAAYAGVDLDGPRSVNALLVSGHVKAGGLSAAVLDDTQNMFVGSSVVSGAGRFRAVCRFASLPHRARIILSNHRTQAPAQSVFRIESIRLGSQPDPVFPTEQ